MASEQKNSTKLKSLNWILWLAIGLLFVAIILYFVFIFGLEDNEKANWGTFGDLIGGTLNPIFALFSLFAIIYTIKIQTEELELSRQELEKTKEELRQSRIAQEEQSDSLEQQNFENTFFQMINVYINIQDKISIEENSQYIFYINESEYRFTTPKGKGFLSKDAFHYISLLVLDTKAKNPSLNLVDIYLGLHDSLNLGHNFGYIYQIINFIDKKCKGDKRFYINLFRAQFTKHELYLLFCHGLSSYGLERFKPLLEDYSFFEHISKDIVEEKEFKHYDIKAFGKKEFLLSKYKESSKS